MYKTSIVSSNILLLCANSKRAPHMSVSFCWKSRTHLRRSSNYFSRLSWGIALSDWRITTMHKDRANPQTFFPIIRCGTVGSTAVLSIGMSSRSRKGEKYSKLYWPRVAADFFKQTSRLHAMGNIYFQSGAVTHPSPRATSSFPSHSYRGGTHIYETLSYGTVVYLGVKKWGHHLWKSVFIMEFHQNNELFDYLHLVDNLSFVITLVECWVVHFDHEMPGFTGSLKSKSHLSSSTL